MNQKIQHRLFNRRNFLKSASGTVALPILSSLATGKASKADGRPAPKRLVCVGTQLGWYKPDFFADNADARLIKPFDAAGESDGSSMLDNTTLLIGSAMADASKHRRVDFPLMIAGGGYKHKRHVSCGADQENKNEMACDLYVTVLQQLGFEMDSFSSSQSNLNGALL